MEKTKGVHTIVTPPQRLRTAQAEAREKQGAAIWHGSRRKTTMDIWFTKRTGKFAFDVFDPEGLEFHLKSIGWRNISHSTTEVYRMERDSAVIIVYPDNSAQVTGQNVQHAIDVLEAA